MSHDPAVQQTRAASDKTSPYPTELPHLKGTFLTSGQDQQQNSQFPKYTACQKAFYAELRTILQHFKVHEYSRACNNFLIAF